MPNRWRQTFRFNRGYWPTQVYIGGANDTVFRGLNVVFEGGPETVFAQAFMGNERLEKPVAQSVLMANTVEVTPGSSYVEASVDFTGLVLPGHLIEIQNKLYLITSMEALATFRISPAFEGEADSTAEVYVPYIIHSTNQVLALSPGGGSVHGLPKGHFLSVGYSPVGSIHLHPGKYGGGSFVGPIGAGLVPAGTLVFNKSDLSPGNVVGFAAPTIPGITAVPGGIKNMPAGVYSLRVARGRVETRGYGPLSEAVQVELTEAGMKMRTVFPVVETGQTSWQVFGSLYSVVEGVTGPWYQITEIEETAVADAGRTIDFEYRDYEIAGRDLASFDNNKPPRASYLSIFGGIPVLLGAYGLAPSDASPDVANNFPYGPVLQPGKAINPEGFPPEAGVPVGQPEPIVGYVEAEGRLFVMTKSYLHIAVQSGNVDAPLIIRPFAQSAFARQGNLIYVEGTLYGFTRNGPIRFSTAGEAGLEDRSFAAIIAEDMKHWKSERVCIGHDPASQSVVFFHANDGVDSDGFWYSTALAYHTKLGVWSTPIEIRSPALAEPHLLEARHATVTSCCTLGGHLHFVAAGQTWVWNAGSEEVDWWLLTPYVDQAAEGLDKSLRGIAATCFLTADGAMGIFGSQSDGVVDIVTAEQRENAPAMTGSLSGEIPVPASGSLIAVKTSRYHKINVSKKRLYAIRIGSTYTPTNGALQDRVDEIVVDGFTHGPKH